MGVRIRLYITALLSICVFHSHGQRVLYSPYIANEFEVAGKVGDHYWTGNREKVRKDEHHGNPKDSIELRNFDIYDSRMNLVNQTSAFTFSEKILKEYLVCGNQYFDQLLIENDRKKTNLIVSRYEEDGTIVKEGQIILSLPFSESANSFLLVRSEDKNKLLLLCFESGAASGMRLHAILFGSNWQQISYKTYDHLLISQPLIQDDFTNYPLEYFSNSPLKLANSGQWLMMLPSRQNTNFSLYHFIGKDSGIIYREIRSPIYSIWEDVSLWIDNEKQEAFAGVLSSFRYPTLKHVEIVHYSMPERRIDFDTSYRFNTLMGYKVKDENLVHESFVVVPGSGFMLFKEYGKSTIQSSDDFDYDHSRVLKFFFASNAIASTLKSPSINKNGYTRYDKLGGTRKNYDRGDLSMFYFPCRRSDSCWSGIMNKEQVTEFNLPWLSYMVVPIQNRLFLLYNSFFRSEVRYGNSTVLDYKGNAINDEGLIYWKFGNLLNFQKARRISANEMAIPYEHNRRFGFSIIRF